MNTVKHNDMANIKELEYQTLRSELLQNQRYVFGRPIFVLSAGAAAAATLSNKYAEYLIYMLPFISLLMVLDLWFSLSRLRSLTRISSYIAVALESELHIWIGWENALRKYRKNAKESNSSRGETTIAPLNVIQNIDEFIFLDWKVYFTPPLIVHFVAILGTFAGTIVAHLLVTSLHTTIAFEFNLPIVGLLAFLLIFPYWPYKMKHWLKHDWNIWTSVLDVKKEAQGQEAQEKSLLAKKIQTKCSQS